MRRLVLAELRQVEHHHFRRAPDHRGREHRRTGRAGRQVVGLAILAHRLDAPGLGIGDGGEAELDLATVMGEPDHVGRVKREARGRQTEGGAFPSHPGLHQCPAAATLGFFGRDRDGKALRGDPRSIDGNAPGLP